MAYEKRLCVLKQMKRGFSADGRDLSGAVYAERLGDELTITPRLVGFAPVKEGSFVLTVWVSGKQYLFDLAEGNVFRVKSAPSLKDGFSALVCFVRGEAESVAFGYCGSAPSDAAVLYQAFTEESGKKRKRAIPTPLPPTELPGQISPQVPLAPGVPVPDTEEDDRPFRDEAGYDDEAIASTDYFRAGVSAGDENAVSCACREGQEKEVSGGGGAREDETHSTLFRVVRGGVTYYNEVREKLEAAFQKYPRDIRLKGAFPQSEWVNAEGTLLGIVYEQGLPRYLCVAVEAAGAPPEEMKDSCVFVPATPYAHNEGFYVVFQDAETGGIVHMQET